MQMMMTTPTWLMLQTRSMPLVRPPPHQRRTQHRQRPPPMARTEVRPLKQMLSVAKATQQVRVCEAFEALYACVLASHLKWSAGKATKHHFVDIRTAQ